MMTLVKNSNEVAASKEALLPLPCLEYNNAYELIVENEQDLEGMIAYALYKRQKREYVLRHSVDRDDPAVKNYHFDLGRERIKSLRSEASIYLRYFSDKMIENMSQEYLLKIQNEGIVKSLTKTIKDETGPIKAIAIGVISSIAFGLLLTAAKVVDWTNPLTASPPSAEHSQTHNP